MQSHIERLKLSIQPARAALLSHSVYSQINDFEGIKHFSKYHVFAVRDFMSLLKYDHCYEIRLAQIILFNNSN
jgi:hypothetical protein